MSSAMSAMLEGLLVRLWRDALSIQAVGPNDNFFDLGGNSLLAIAVHHRLQGELGRRIPVVELFQHPTVRTLAEWLTSNGIAAPLTSPANQAALVPHRPAPTAPMDPYTERARKQSAAFQELRARAHRSGVR